MGDGKQLDRSLDPAGEHADGHVDAGKKAGERADDGAGHRKGVGRFDERNKKGDESPTCDRRKHDQAQSFQHRRQGQELAAIGPDEDLGEDKGQRGQDYSHRHRGQEVAAHDGAPLQGAQRKSLAIP